MIAGVGVDIVDIKRIGKTAGGAFIKKNFTAEETALFERRKYKPETVAANFAAKEAVMKSLGCGIFEIPLSDIEILRSETGKPVVNLYGKAKEKAEELGVKRVHVSISHDMGLAAAQAVAEGD